MAQLMQKYLRELALFIIFTAYLRDTDAKIFA